MTSTAIADPPPAVADPTSPRLPVRLGLLVNVLWLLALILMVIGTANPIQVSPAQIRMADAVVTARRTGDFQIEVERVWSGTIREGKASVANLDKTSLPQGVRTIVPLSRFKIGWQVTILPGQDPDKPLTYPATPQVLNDMRKALPR